MPFLIEHITEVIFILFVVVLLGNFFLIGVTLIRRQRREKYFQRIDALRHRYGPVVSGLLAGQVGYSQGLAELRGITGSDRLFMLEQICLEQKPTPGQELVLRRLCEDLGLVKIWQQRLMGQIDPASLKEVLIRPQGLMERVSSLHFLIRAKSAQNLGFIRHEPSWPLLVKALEDPHPDLRSVAARALAAIRHPGSFPALVEQLQKIVVEPASGLSLRALKSALVTFPLESAVELLTLFRDGNPRIRFFATETVREMVEREAAGKPDFSLDARNMDPELAEIFLEQLPLDENPDVRARAVPVIAYLANPRSTSVLLTLLQDPTWFVRLHGVRSMAKRKFLSQASQIASVLSDPNWRVREAAVRTLRSFGSAGLDRLTDYFLRTDDRYSREQIADEFQRAGLIPELVAHWSESDDGQEGRVIEHLAEMGKTSYLLSVVVQSNGDGRLQKRFLQRFGRYPDPQIQQWVRQSAKQESDSELRGLAEATLTAHERHGEV